MKKRRVNAFAVQPDVMFYVHRHEILSLASREGLPAIYFFKEFAQGGGLLSYAVSLDDIARLATAYVAKILKGAKPADLPVEPAN